MRALKQQLSYSAREDDDVNVALPVFDPATKDGRDFCLFHPTLGSSKIGSTQGKAFGRNSIPPPEGLPRWFRRQRLQPMF